MGEMGKRTWPSGGWRAGAKKKISGARVEVTFHRLALNPHLFSLGTRFSPSHDRQRLVWLVYMLCSLTRILLYGRRYSRHSAELKGSLLAAGQAASPLTKMKTRRVARIGYSGGSRVLQQVSW